MWTNVLIVETKNENDQWEELFSVPYVFKAQQKYPVVAIFDKDHEEELKKIKNQIIRFKTLEIDPNSEEEGMYHIWELGNWRLIKGQLVVYNENENVRYFTIKP